MASPDYIDVVGGVFGRSYEDVTLFLHFSTGRILACAFCVARVEATTLRVAPATSDVPCAAIYCSSVAGARFHGNPQTLLGQPSHQVHGEQSVHLLHATASKTRFVLSASQGILYGQSLEC